MISFAAVTLASLIFRVSTASSAKSPTKIVPSNILAQIETAIENGEELTYFATDYKLVLDNGSLGITVQEGSDLLVEIINQFRLDFERTYINQINVFNSLQ